MDDLQTLLDTAEDLKKAGKTESALEAYSKAFDFLIDEAGRYARAEEADVTDMTTLRTMTEVLFAHSKDYLQRNLDAASILNTMGILFAELGDLENARQKFLEAIEFIPSTVIYEEPEKNLEDLRLKMSQAAPDAFFADNE